MRAELASSMESSFWIIHLPNKTTLFLAQNLKKKNSSDQLQRLWTHLSALFVQKERKSGQITERYH